MAGNLMEFQFKSSIDRMMKRSAYIRGLGGMEELLIGLRLGLRCGISKKVYELVFVIDWKVIDVETSFGSIRRRVAGKIELNY